MANLTPEEMATELGSVGADIARDKALAALQAAELVTGELRAISYSAFRTHRTGELGRSWRSRFVSGTGSYVLVGSFSDAVQARILDEGGVIHPRVRKMLAVPVVPMAIGKWPRHFPAGFLQYRPGPNPGTAFLVKPARVSKKGNPVKGAKDVVYYVLKRSITVAGRGYINAAWRNAEPLVAEHLESWTATKMGGGR